jgi:Tfp pilus assembly major pilin PilA
MYGFGVPELVIIVVIAIVAAIGVLPYWKIFSKAGYSGWLSLTQIVPILNIVVIFYVAFAEWPVQRELTVLKQRS